MLVTGAGGFIGSSVVRALLLRGATVRALAGAPGQETLELPAQVTQVHADIEDSGTLTGLATGVDVAIHLAGPPSVAASFQAPLEYGRVHAMGTLAMLEACRAGRVPRFVLVSSAEVYGRPDANPVSEDQPLRPRSPYAAGKSAAEHFVGAYARAFGTQTVILRPFSVYGPGLPLRSVLGTILEQVLSAEEVVLADLTPVRDYCFLDDIVEGVILAASESGSQGTFNLGSGVGTSVGDLAALALRVAGRRLPVRSDPSRRRPAAADIDRLVADRTHAQTMLGWSPAVSLEDGLARTLKWMKAGK